MTILSRRGRLKRGWLLDPSCILYLPLYRLDGALIRSRDAYGHLATVSGATWGLQGRYFDGIGDKIETANKAVFAIPTYFTAYIWLKRSSEVVAVNAFFGTQTGVNNGWALNVNQQQNGSVAFYVYTSSWVCCPATPVAGMIALNTWEHWKAIYDNGSMILVRNGGQNTYTAATSGNIAGTSHIVGIGKVDNANPAKGSVGEVLIRNGVDYSHQHYLMTKWRYQ